MNKPITKKDVEKVLFDKNGSCVKMMEEGEYEPLIAFMYQLVYYQFLERSP